MKLRWVYPFAALCAAAALSGCGSTAPAANITRHYAVTAEETAWNYAPNGIVFSPYTTSTYPPAGYVTSSASTIGSTYRKARFTQWSSPRPDVTRKSTIKCLGIVGPVIKAETGDTIVVHFRNNTSRPLNLHPEGLYVSSEEPVVPPGGEADYTWKTDQAGPGINDPNSVVWRYTSTVDPVGDENAGLIGPIIIYTKGALSSEGVVSGVDREVVALFKTFDENASPYLQQNIDTYLPGADTTDPLFKETNRKRSINGLLFGNFSTSVRKDQRSRWYLLAGTFDNATDFDTYVYTPHWEENAVLYLLMSRDTVQLPTATQLSVDLIPKHPGQFLFDSPNYAPRGMVGQFTVTEK